jgi:hypothetical protein
MGRLINLKGKTFSRLTVIKRVKRTSNTGGCRWACQCSCGNKTTVASYDLRRELVRSCGCLRREQVYERGSAPNQLERAMLTRARMRAKRDRIPFSLTLEDIHIPEYCPVFGVKLMKVDSNRERSPSLDRKDNSLGYVAGNVQVICYRANRIKNDSTADELRAILLYLDGGK